MIRIRLFALAALSTWTIAGCRFSYEVRGDDVLGGAPGDGDVVGDGDGDTGGRTGTGGKSSSGGGSTGGSLQQSGGSNSGGSDSGGGGAESGGTDSGGSAGSSGGDSGGSGTGGGTGTGGSDLGTGGVGTGGAGTGGVGTGGAGTGGVGTGGAGTGGSGTVIGDYVVDTGVDENDGGADTGTGLSLREAMTLANAAAGVQTITFEADVTVVLVLGNLPNITEGLRIIGTGNRIDASNQGDSRETFFVQADDVVFEGISVENTPNFPALFKSGANARVENCEFRNTAGPLLFEGASAVIRGNLFQDGLGDCLSVQGSSPILRENRIFDCGGNGIFFGKDAGGALVVGNLIVRADTGFGFAGLTGADMWFNSIANSTGNGVLVGQASGLDFRNNVVVGNGSYGVNGASSNFTAFGYNLLFGNVNGACNGCTIDATFVTADPLFVDGSVSAEAGFYLQGGSPAIDSGIDVGEDRNAGNPLNYDGAAPDLGFWESN